MPHPVLSYFMLTFVITWGGLLAVGALSAMTAASWQSDPRLPLLVIAMLAGPSVSGLLLTRMVSGRAGLRELLARALRWRVGVRWYLVALLAAPVVFSAVHVGLSFVSPVFLPTVLSRHDMLFVLIAGVGPALVIGVLEEIGWTGFATPRLRLQHTAVVTGLLVGVPWGAWHLLTNDIWIARTYNGELSPSVFAVLNGACLLAGQLPAFRVLMVWIYDRTGSLLVAMLMHASLSASTFIIGPAKVVGLALIGYGFAQMVAWWIVVAVVHAVIRRQPGRSVATASRGRVAA